jgi:hypothetical protein
MARSQISLSKRVASGTPDKPSADARPASITFCLQILVRLLARQAAGETMRKQAFPTLPCPPNGAP